MQEYRTGTRKQAVSSLFMRAFCKNHAYTKRYERFLATSFKRRMRAVRRNGFGVSV